MIPEFCSSVISFNVRVASCNEKIQCARILYAYRSPSSRQRHREVTIPHDVVWAETLLGKENDEACIVAPRDLDESCALRVVLCPHTPVALISPSLGALRLLILVPGITIFSSCVVAPTLVFSVESGFLVLFVQYFFHSCPVPSISPMICWSHVRASSARFSARLPLHLHQPVIRNLRVCLLIDCLPCHRL